MCRSRAPNHTVITGEASPRTPAEGLEELSVSRTVLVVDDDTWIRDVLEMALESAGYEVILAQDGLEALEQLDYHRPSLMILDLMMPNVNGFELAEQLRLRGLRA